MGVKKQNAGHRIHSTPEVSRLLDRSHRDSDLPSSVVRRENGRVAEAPLKQRAQVLHDDRSMFWVADLRQAARSSMASPGLAAALVLTIGIGAGGDAAIIAFTGGFSAHVAASLSTADRLEFGRVRVLLFAASGLILVLAAATVAGLRLSHAAARTRETAIRVSLGASRRRLAWQSLVESGLVAVAGGGVAAVAHMWTSHLVPMLLFAEDAERLTWSPDWTALALTTLVWVVVIAACGLAPAWAIPQDAPIGVLKGDRPSVFGSPNRFRRWLVVAQIGLCVLLVEGAGVIREDVHQALRTERARMLASLAVTRVQALAEASSGTGGADYLAAVKAAVEHVPSVVGAAWIATLPGSRATSRTSRDRTARARLAGGPIRRHDVSDLGEGRSAPARRRRSLV